MKKTIIGAILAVCGTILDTGIILAASVYCTTLNSWTGSKFWYSVFGAPTYGYEANLSLNLGVPFVFGAVILFLGAAVLVMELFHKNAQ